MNILFLLVALYLTFMLAINHTLLTVLTRGRNISHNSISTANLYLWCGIIMLIGLLGLDRFYIALPQEGITLQDVGLIIAVLIPFMVGSEYTPKKTINGVTTFCLVFPVFEEILFRGIILWLLTQSFLFAALSIEIPVPILRGVSLQVFVSALLFGVAHLQHFNFRLDHFVIKKVGYAFVFGLIAGNLVQMTGSIVYGIIFHIIANTGACLYNYLVPSKQQTSST